MEVQEAMMWGENISYYTVLIHPYYCIDFLNLNYHILFTCMNLFHNLFGKSTNLCQTYTSTNALFKLKITES